ncbi:non-specific lipid-transfer protein-like protein At5g64080 [Phalaenopsis equestris]|uniref:non-specific lipid-transfer protein-like protein At5g64080 n=1 Tax=Phalaenopsis equestris TaxID=78828 RepID=UPI0009E49980|nr:non-specific lipid-transfer protein-like protein At5g64080 [Phalaenopsis equestris]
MFQLPPSSSSTFPQMAPNQSELTLVAFLISTLFAITAVQSSNSCTSTLIDLSSCLNYISGNTTTPPSSCCSQLRSTNLEPQCLCTFLFGGGGSALGISINKTQALALPDACNVHTPSIVQCFASLPPPSSGSPSTSDTPSGGGSNVVPSVDTSGAHGNTVKISIMIFVSLIFMVVLASASVISV